MVFHVVKCEGYAILEVELLVITKESLDEKISLILARVFGFHWIGYALDINDLPRKVNLVCNI